MRDKMGTPFSPFERDFFNDAMVEVRSTLGEEKFLSAWEEGRAMTPEQAIAEFSRDLPGE